MCHPRGEIVVANVAEQPFADTDRNVVRIERALDREQPVALLVLLADADRLVGGAVKLLADLHFDERALFLDHDNEIEASGEVHQILTADRPRTTDLIETQTEVVALHLIEPEFVERLPDVEVAL